MKKKSKIAFLFPGQGSQFVGMGYDLYQNEDKGKAVFDEVDEALHQKLSKVIFEGTQEELTMTSNTQPAIMATSIATLKVFLIYAGYNNISEICEIVAGHSLGEYSALCAVESIELNDTAKLLRIRGDSMQNSVPKGVGGMVALIGANIEKAQIVCDAAIQSLNNNDLICQIANDNGAEQIVVSGNIEAMDKVVEIASNYEIKRAIKLPVSAPFHSKLMTPAESVMQNALLTVKIKPPLVPVIANYTAQLNDNANDIPQLLVNQISHKVRWKETMHILIKSGYNIFIECGPGKVLTTLINREFNVNNGTTQINGEETEIKTFNICSIQEIEKCLESLSN